MGVENLNKLAALIEVERANLLTEWRRQIRELPSAKHLDSPTLTDHIPAFLQEIAAAFRTVRDESIPEAMLESTPHAREVDHARERAS